jgi:hypothetical protein
MVSLSSGKAFSRKERKDNQISFRISIAECATHN